MLVGGGALAGSWYTAHTWAATGEAELAERRLAAETPRWVEVPPTPRLGGNAPTAGPARSARPVAAEVRQPAQDAAGDAAADRQDGPRRPTPTEDGAGAPPRAAVRPVFRPSGRAREPDASAAPDLSAVASAPDETPPEPAEEPRASAEAIRLVESELVFLDPPEPGARARILVVVRNEAALPTAPLRLGVPARWLRGWRVVGAEPALLAERTESSGLRAFEFPPLQAGDDATLSLELVAVEDDVDPPDLRLTLPSGELIGWARPETVAPRPRPGPARVLEIPRLGLRAAVVPTAWEPPSFVVGQLRETANLSEGNTVLIGHLTGLAGNVFADLDQLQPGDEVVAISRGLPYQFVVSEVMVLPGDDSRPLQPTDEPRLTLMTCAGEWDPIGHDYSHRLWVVAEPPEQAARTLAGAPGPLTRTLGLDGPLAIQPPPLLGDSPKERAPDVAEAEAADALEPAGVAILEPADGASVEARLTVRGIRTEEGDPRAPLWLVVRAEVAGSRWYAYGEPLALRPDRTWEVSLELGGTAGIRHTIVVAPVDPDTDARLRRHAAEQPGQPLDALPPPFERGAHVVVERR